MSDCQFVYSAYTASVAATRSKISTRDEIKWDELLRRER